MSNSKFKTYLKLLMVIGLLAIVGGGSGTFASFSAQTTNKENTFATGSLLLSNTANGGTACLSDKGAGNVNSNCSAFVKVETEEPGSSAIGTVVVKNEGTLDASKLTLYAPTSKDCQDTSVVALGEKLNEDATKEALCKAVLMYVQEQTGGNNYCWSGNGEKSATGMCTAPISVKLSEALETKATTNLPVAELNGNVASGDSVRVSVKGHEQTFEAAANAYIGATSITIESATPNFAYPTESNVTDTTTLATLNSDTTDTISGFDASHYNEHEMVELLPLESNGKTTTGVELAKNGGSRTFKVGLYLPKTEESQNELQDLKSTFGLTWHIDQ